MRKLLVFIALAILMVSSSCKSNPGQLTLITDANDIYADRGRTAARLTATLTDKDGLAIISARIDFTCSHGEVVSPVLTNSFGVASTRFRDTGRPSLDQNNNPVPAIITAEYAEDNIKVSTEVSILELPELEADSNKRAIDARNDLFYDSLRIEHEESMRHWMEAQRLMDLQNYSEAVIHLKRHKDREPRPDKYNHILSCIAETYALNKDVDSAFQYLDLYVDGLNEDKNQMERSASFYNREYSYMARFEKKAFQVMHEDPRWPIFKKRADAVVSWIKEYESSENRMKFMEAEGKQADDFVELMAEVDSLEKTGKYDSAIKVCKDVAGYENSGPVLSLIAGLYCSKGDIEMTFDYLEQAKLITEGRAQLMQRFLLILTMGNNPQFLKLEGDPRFRKLSSDPRWEMMMQEQFSKH